MPRKARINAAGALHHIICRGIEGQRVFRDDKDRDNFVKRLGKILEDSFSTIEFEARLTLMEAFKKGFLERL